MPTYPQKRLSFATILLVVGLLMLSLYAWSSHKHTAPKARSTSNSNTCNLSGKVVAIADGDTVISNLSKSTQR